MNSFTPCTVQMCALDCQLNSPVLGVTEVGGCKLKLLLKRKKQLVMMVTLRLYFNLAIFNILSNYVDNASAQL